ncbi:LCP family protein [Streptomyces profundus]|uniref:LCP family protein n=1 Tax=Streptomyces profundus TaxID=2867410 RepID=UPI001D15E921|nr:LCP family protein [Streptomyces sp. MA3_2.13]UED86489.1 LCP family protein [Streptomyces sp. MA3_2.13]
MNDRQQPYGQIYGYDEYGRPLYQPLPEQPHGHEGVQGVPGGHEGYRAQPADGYAGYPGQGATGYQEGGAAGYPGHPGYEGYDGYEGYQGHQGYQGYDSQAGYQPVADHDTGQQAPVPPQPHGYDQRGYQADYGGYQPVAEYDTGQQAPVPPVVAPPEPATFEPAIPEPVPPLVEEAVVPEQRRPATKGDDRDDYQTEQFSFVEEPDEDSEDVIDWMKFSESRTERREEAKRRGRGRRRLLVVTLVLALVGGLGFLWATDRIPGLAGEEEVAAPEARSRDVIVVHLRQVDSPETATALLVADESAGTGATLLLPNNLSVTADSGSTTLGQAVVDESAGSVRDALSGLLGADIKGTWRLGTPYLSNLVDLVSGITVSTDVEVPSPDEDEGPLVEAGEDVSLNGPAAVAYATYRAPDEAESAQLNRFGQVMQAVLERLPDSESAAVTTMETLRQIQDPSLSEQELGLSLARLAAFASAGDYLTSELPVEDDGTISDATADGVVHEVLGGSVSNADPGATARIGIRDGSGVEGAGEAARITLINGGLTVVDSRATDESAAESQVLYSVPEHRETAIDAARTLGLPEEVVTEGDGPGTADVTIVLGEDYGR